MSNSMSPYIVPSPTRNLDFGHLGGEVVQLLLDAAVLLDSILVPLLQLGVLVLECLHLPLVVTSLDVGLAKPEFAMSQHRVVNEA